MSNNGTMLTRMYVIKIVCKKIHQREWRTPKKYIRGDGLDSYIPDQEPIQFVVVGE